MLIPRYILSLALIGSFFSCRKDDVPNDLQPRAPSIEDYSQLMDGNYWVYERSALDSSGNYVGQPLDLDSVWVAGDSLIDGVAWKKIRSSPGGDFPSLCFQRDSMDRLLLRNHGVLMGASSTNAYLWTEHFPGIVDVNYTLFVTPQTVLVNAGTFTCQEVRGLIPFRHSRSSKGHSWA